VLITGTAISQDFRQNLNKSIFSDQKANRIGDAVTILVVEQLTASNDASTSSSRASDLSLSASGDLSSIGASVGTGNQFKGSGATASHGVVRTKLSARVDSVLENGNLVIQGNRKIVINGEEQSMKISGVVRPSDIQADNSVYSYNISDASIMFEGSGIVSRAQGPGWVTKFLHWLF
jgi:flagellar L-ring protein FlgH